jgi:hypothetical protein
MAARKCNECNQRMTEGYCIEGGMAYYCSDKCMHKHYSISAWSNLYNNGEGDSYWTTWEMTKITYEEAKERYFNDLDVYCMNRNGSVELAEHMDDIICHEGTCGEFGIE